jgi:hypothetical protein
MWKFLSDMVVEKAQRAIGFTALPLGL